MAVWGPYHHRLAKKIRLKGIRLNSQGEIVPVEINGPADFESWRESYSVFRTGCIMFGQISPARLDGYEHHIRSYHERYGRGCWALLYQADVRARLELAERLRRQGKEDRDNAIAAGGTHGFDPKKPWEWVWNMIVKDHAFWHRELEEPALLILAKTQKASQLLGTDAPVDAPGDLGVDRPPSAPSAPAKRKRDDNVRQHMIGEDGLLTHNRPLRLPGDRDIYGRQEDVRLGTLLALRAADTFMLFYELAGRWKNVLVRDEPNMQPCNDVVNTGVVPHLSWSPALRGKQGLADEDVDMHLGGMRHPRRAMETITGYDRIGKAIFHTLDRPSFQRSHQSPGSGLDYGLLGAWGRIAGDPDTDFIEDDAQQDDDEGQDYFHDPAGHENYDDPMALPEIQRLIDTGYVKVFDDLESCQAWLGGPPLTSKLAMVTKVRSDGTTKRRLILDCRESGANLLAHEGGRVQLPRPTDSVDEVDDSLYLLSRSKGEEVEALVLDFKDWFYQFHLNMRSVTTSPLPTAKDPGGSKNAPIVCGRVAAFIGRLSQSLFLSDRARLQVYVDDPCFLMVGSQGQRDRLASILICMWMSLRIPLAFGKASRGADFTWIGVHYHIKAGKDGKVTVTGKTELMQEILEATEAHQKVNVISVRDLQKYVGKANYVAGVVDTWRPFLTDLWAVINSCGPESRPKNCVWTKQWAHVTAWFLAFYRGEVGALTREYRVSHYFGRAIKMRIVTDACPWGIGGFLAMNNTPIAYFSDALCDFDLELAEAERGSPDGQQVWESLALLVTLRLWTSHWVKRGVDLHLESDSVS
ncbi:unnamed protein product, partial [Symbiodinium necroappetens]